MTDVDTVVMFELVMHATHRMSLWLLGELEQGTWKVIRDKDGAGIGISFKNEQDAVIFRLMFDING
jgi:hypothetical protein